MKRVARQCAGAILGAAAAWLDDAVDADQLRRWLVKSLYGWSGEVPSNPVGRAEAEMGNDLRTALALTDQCSFAGEHLGIEPVSRFPAHPASDDDASAACSAWRAGLEEARVVRRSVVAADAGRWLDWLAERAWTDDQEFVAANSETLLRHVELKRGRALSQFGRSMSRADLWQQRHEVAIFFCRQTRRRGDLRLLNAAMKLNDWAFAAHRTLSPGPQLARYLLAVSEQEFTAERIRT